MNKRRSSKQIDYTQKTPKNLIQANKKKLPLFNEDLIGFEQQEVVPADAPVTPQKVSRKAILSKKWSKSNTPAAVNTTCKKQSKSYINDDDGLISSHDFYSRVTASAALITDNTTQ